MLIEAGWRFFDSEEGKANILLENNVKITQNISDEWGEDFEVVEQGYVDLLLLDETGFPLVVLEAKRESIDPLAGKEQARKYAKAQHCRFIILSNGNQHYFWDTEMGSPHIISRFPSPNEGTRYTTFKPNPEALAKETIGADYIALTQRPDYAKDPSWLNESERPKFIEVNHLSLLRAYQVQALKAIQKAVDEGKDRFLLEMATGTGKTLVAAALIKLFLRTGNARRVLFLVDRLELEDQAKKNFKRYLKNDYQCVIYKENRSDWRKAEIVISTVQTMLAGNRYNRLFAPDDFDLVISDEAHRSINGNSRAVFEYFRGYKLGLTATPKNYLKNIDPEKIRQDDPRELERRMLLDTYKTFGCADGTPTFSYSLVDGVRDGYLINPIVVDARTDISTQLLSDEGYSVLVPAMDGEDVKEAFEGKDFEKKFFSEATNKVFCQVFLQNALRDPISGELGKSIIFCVSQRHAGKIAQILNEEAEKIYPGKYHSDFAVQVTSNVTDAQQMSINFANNKLLGFGNFNADYRTSKARVCVTVGMMTTGYDCEDILNLGLMRPIFSPTDFVQIKGRGTRTYDFSRDLTDPALKKQIGAIKKERYKLFDFFANCEYFETEFNYDEVLQLPMPGKETEFHRIPQQVEPGPLDYVSTAPDFIQAVREQAIGLDGMRIDRKYFEKFEERIKKDEILSQKIQAGNWGEIEKYMEEKHYNQPLEYYNRDKLKQALKVDRRISTRDILEFIFGLTPYIKAKEELLEDEFNKYDTRVKLPQAEFQHAKNVFKAYASDGDFRKIVDGGQFAMLNVHPSGQSFQKISPALRKQIPEYIKDYVYLNQFLE